MMRFPSTDFHCTPQVCCFVHCDRPFFMLWGVLLRAWCGLVSRRGFDGARGFRATTWRPSCLLRPSVVPRRCSLRILRCVSRYVSIRSDVEGFTAASRSRSEPITKRTFTGCGHRRERRFKKARKTVT